MQLSREIHDKIEISEIGIVIYFLLLRYQCGPLLYKELPCVRFHVGSDIH